MLAAAEHAKQCPTCAARFEQFQGLEQELAQLPGVESSADFASRVMSRIAESAPVESAPWDVNAWELLRDGALLVAGLLLAFSYLWPAAGESWLSHMWSWSGSIPLITQSAYLSQYLSQHSPWAVLLGALASAWLIAAIFLENGRRREDADVLL